MFMLLAQAHWGVGQMAVALVVVAAVCALVFIAFRQMGVAIPPFIVQILWVLICAVAVIAAIRFVMTL